MKKVFAIALALLMVVSMCACSSAKKGDAADTIKIGLAFPMSGTAAMAGKYSTHGAEVLKKNSAARSPSVTRNTRLSLSPWIPKAPRRRPPTSIRS